MRIVFVALILMVTASCQSSTKPNSDSGSLRVPPDTRVAPLGTLTLRVGETVVVHGAEIAFTRVVEDSRCPVDVVCPWAGNAAVELGVGPGFGGEGPTYQLVLNSLLDPHEGEAWGIRVRLLDVHPQPVSTQPIPPDAYSIDLSVEASGAADAS